MTTIDEAFESGEPIAWAIVGKRTGDIYSVQRGRPERQAKHLDAAPLYTRPVVTDEMVERAMSTLGARGLGGRAGMRDAIQAALTPPNE